MNECNNLDFGVISVEEFAKGVGVAKSTVYEWIRFGEIPQTCWRKVGGKYFIKREKAREWLESDG